MLRTTTVRIRSPCLVIRRIPFRFAYVRPTASRWCSFILLCKTRHSPEWETPKQILNRTCDWSSLKWRRQILSLLYFHHVFYQFPSLLIRFKFNVSLSCRHPSSIVLPRSGAHFLKSPLFRLSVEWNKLPEHIRCVLSSVNFRIALKARYSQHRYSLTGIPNFSV